MDKSPRVSLLTRKSPSDLCPTFAAILTSAVTLAAPPLHAQRPVDDAAVDRAIAHAERVCTPTAWPACADAYERALVALGIQPGSLEWGASGFAWLSSRDWRDPMRTGSVVLSWGEAVLLGRGDALKTLGAARAAYDLFIVRRWTAGEDVDIVEVDDAIRRSVDVEAMVLSSLKDQPRIPEFAFSRINAVRARVFMNAMWASFEAHREGWVIGETGRLEFIERDVQLEAAAPLRKAFQAQVLQQTIQQEGAEATPRRDVLARLRSQYRRVVGEFDRSIAELGDDASWREALQSLDVRRDTDRNYGGDDTPLVSTNPRILPIDWALLQFHVTDRQVLAFYVDRATSSLLDDDPREITLVDLGNPDEIAQTVRRFKQQVEDPSQLGWKFTAGELYRLLLAPVLPARGRRPAHLVIVPSRFLFELPFGLLRDPRTDSLLLQTIPHSYVPHPDVLPFLGFGRDEIDDSQQRALAVGVRRFSSSSWAELQLGEQEATDVAGIVPIPTSLRLASRGETATDRVVEDMQGHVVVHLSSHATVDRRPWLSGIVLKSGTGRDSVLTALDLTASDELFPPGLVVLAACETGIIDPGDNDEVRGLTGALFLSGFQTIIASQWKVPERGTLRLMRQFYRALAGSERMSVTLALRQAQLELATDVHPFYWAGFMVFGNGRLSNTALFGRNR